MDTYRAFLAIIISFVILITYQYFFVGFEQEPVPAQNGEVAQQQTVAPQSQPVIQQPLVQQPVPAPAAAVAPARAAKEFTFDTDLYTAVVTEGGGAIKSFVLKQHRETLKEEAGKELIRTDANVGLPLKFSWGGLVAENQLYDSKGQGVVFDDANQKGRLQMQASTPLGIQVERTLSFDKSSYLMNLSVKVKNTSAQPLQGNAQLHMINQPFVDADNINRFLFHGSAAFINGELQEIKSKEYEEGPKTLQGAIDWMAYEGTYFMCAVVPTDAASSSSMTIQGTEELTRMQLTGNIDTLQPGEEKVYAYRVFFGPKKLSMLEETGYNLDKAVNFGWFDIIAKPTLMLLNFFYGFVKNYGIAIVLVTILFKAVFWPITQKGMKSMKNMQKLQPKMVKLKEKYKDDPTKMNQEVMNLYKTYKVNPLGGCLPMLLQIPVFFALYKVLLQCIELRHAPFMLWITDLAAPDRLWAELNIPYLGGIPVLTLLMGASMFLQQKLTPTTADPTQARIMMFLPVVFTFMFLNFASGLVLYWFVNNLLAILQQQLINRQSK